MARRREPAPGDELNSETRGVSRRDLLLSAGFAAGGAAAVALTRPPAAPAPAEAAEVAAAGRHQAGVARPAVPQEHCLLAIGSLDVSALSGSLTALGEAIRRVCSPTAYVREITPDGPGDLTVTVGLGARALAASAHPELASLVALPVFAGDAKLPAYRLGGDLMLSVNAGDATILEPVLSYLTATVAGFSLHWSDLGVRGPEADGISRNPFGYYDGIIIPRTDADLSADVWIADGPLAGGTICVVRRFGLDTAGFRALPAPRRDSIIGRHQGTGAPLSGGRKTDEINLAAKADNGELLVPARAHARAAHPSFTGSALMLRRSYSYRTSATDHGHLFISYQRTAETFARTQLRLDEVDDLMAFSTPLATAAFAILPGAPADSSGALGSSLA